MTEAKIVERDGVAGILSCAVPQRVARDVPMATLGSWKIGGLASVVVTPSSIEELQTTLHILNKYGASFVVLGAGTNLLFPDEGLRAIAIRMTEFRGISIRHNQIHVSSGVWVPRVAMTAMRLGLTGAEHISGIPGTMGGLICMNGGSLRQSIGDSIVEVTSIDERGELITRRAQDCGFGYRKSIYQQVRETIVSAALAFDRAEDARAVRRKMLDILKSRRLKFPRKTPNCGSVFASSLETYADHGPPGMIFEKLGLKGLRVGGAFISDRHANFIINDASATADDVLTLIAAMKSRALNVLGVNLSCEVKYLLPDGRICPADQAAAGKPNE